MSARASLSWLRHLVPLPARSWLLDFRGAGKHLNDALNFQGGLLDSGFLVFSFWSLVFLGPLDLSAWVYVPASSSQDVGAFGCLTDIFIFELLDRICAASACVCVCLRRDANLALNVLLVG